MVPKGEKKRLQISLTDRSSHTQGPGGVLESILDVLGQRLGTSCQIITGPTQRYTQPSTLTVINGI